MDLYNRLELGDIRNVNEEEQEKFFYQPIYQILPLEYAKSVTVNKEIRFNNVFISWEDPYELFIFKQKTFIDGKSFSIDNYEKRIYGQCWSLNKDTDAMWRIYSPGEKRSTYKDDNRENDSNIRPNKRTDVDCSFVWISKIR